MTTHIEIEFLWTSKGQKNVGKRSDPWSCGLRRANGDLFRFGTEDSFVPFCVERAVSGGID